MSNIINALTNSAVPLNHRYMQMQTLVNEALQGNEEYAKMVNEIFESLGKKNSSEEVQKMKEHLKLLISDLDKAPQRPATFIQRDRHQVLVAMDNGELGYVTDIDLSKEDSGLTLGDRVTVDAHMKVMIRPMLNGLKFGEEVRYERRIDDRHIEITNNQEQKAVVMAPPHLMTKIKEGKLTPGRWVVLAHNKLMALDSVNSEDALQYFRYLDRGPIPDVSVERDIGAPPKVIELVARHIREEMTRPERRRQYRLRPCRTFLLAGVSGTGKSLAVAAIHRQMYEIMEELTGIPIKELPPQVFRFRASQAFSMWFGESDKNVDRFFDEVEQRAGQTIRVKNKDICLPVLVVMEEADGMGRHRGDEPIYDRIMTTTLQRLDPNRSSLANKLVIFLSTTNEPHLVDPAMLRRIGGSVETFGRLDQAAFNAILRKHVEGLPAEGRGWSSTLKELDAWLYEKDPGIIQLHCQGHSEPVTKYRRDFLTGALIDRAVQEAASETWEQSLDDDTKGISVRQIAQALDRQVLNVVHQLQPNNVDRYTDIPEGVRVSQIKRIPVHQ